MNSINTISDPVKLLLSGSNNGAESSELLDFPLPQTTQALRAYVETHPHIQQPTIDTLTELYCEVVNVIGTFGSWVLFENTADRNDTVYLWNHDLQTGIQTTLSNSLWGNEKVSLIESHKREQMLTRGPKKRYGSYW